MFGFHPVIGDWFLQRFGEATEPQRRAWPSLQSGRDALITAPTGSGKTLAAFLVCLDRLVKAAAADALVDQVQVLYVSPLKALSTDIHRNLDAATRRDCRDGGGARDAAAPDSLDGADGRHAGLGAAAVRAPSTPHSW